MTLCVEDDSNGRSGAGEIGVSQTKFAPPHPQQLASGKWYKFSERTVCAFPAKQRGYLSADIQSNTSVQTTVVRAKYVGTLAECSWFPRQEIAGNDVVVHGLEGVQTLEDVLIFLQVPPEAQRLHGQIWIAFALHAADVRDLILDQA